MSSFSSNNLIVKHLNLCWIVVKRKYNIIYLIACNFHDTLISRISRLKKKNVLEIKVTRKLIVAKLTCNSHDVNNLKSDFITITRIYSNHLKLL